MEGKLVKPMKMRHLGGPRYTDAEFRQKMEERRKTKETKQKGR